MHGDTTRWRIARAVLDSGTPPILRCAGSRGRLNRFRDGGPAPGPALSASLCWILGALSDTPEQTNGAKAAQSMAQDRRNSN